MKLKNLFGLTFLLLQILCINLVAFEENEQLICYLPQEITHIIAQNFNSCETIASLKRTCKWLDQTIGYKDLPSHIIELENYDMISDGLIATAHQNKQQDHKALLVNNPQKRNEALGELGWNEKLSLTESIRAYCGLPEKSAPKNLSKAILNNNLALKILSSSVNPNIKDTDGYTPLLHTCWQNNTAKVQLLLNNENIDPNIPEKSGKTALHYACEHNYTKIVELLLSHPKTNPNTQKKNGLTALHYACINDFTEIALLLLADKRIKPNIQDEYCYTALDYAWLKTLETGNTETIKQFHDLGARHSWKHYVPHTIGISIMALLISYVFYRIVYNNNINTITMSPA